MRRFMRIVRAVDTTLAVVMRLALMTMATALIGWGAGCLLGMAWGVHLVNLAKAAGEKTDNSTMLTPLGELGGVGIEFGLFTGPLWYVLLAYRERRRARRAAAAAASPVGPPRSGERTTAD